MGVNVFVSPTIRAAGGNIFVNPGVVELNLYTLTSTGFGIGLLTIPASATRFNAFTFGAGGNGEGFGGFIAAGGGGGGGRAETSYDKTGGGALALNSDSGRPGELTRFLLGTTLLLSATTGNNSNFAPGTGGSGTVANATITGWTEDPHTTPTYTGNTGCVNQGAGNNNHGGGVGGNTGGEQGRRGDVALLPLVFPQGRGGSFGGGTGNFPGGGGGSGGAVQTGAGPGANGGVIIQVIAPVGLVAGNFSLTNFSFVDNGPIVP